MTSLTATKPTKETYMSISHKICSVDRCNSFGSFRNGNYRLYQGLCNKHYLRYKAHSTTDVQEKRMCGQTHHRLYNTYASMKVRCYNKNHRYYHRYGGRGIIVCDRWLGYDGFLNFIKDMGEKPTNSHTLDRVNNDGDYSLKNCRWADKFTQANNTSYNRVVRWEGIDYSLTSLIRKLGLENNLSAIRSRIYIYNWDIEKALTTPVNKYKKSRNVFLMEENDGTSEE